MKTIKDVVTELKIREDVYKESADLHLRLAKNAMKREALYETREESEQASVYLERLRVVQEILDFIEH